MKILKENMDQLLLETQYEKRREFLDEKLNDFLNYWSFLEEKEAMLRNVTKESIEVILYSKYYWCSRFKERYIELYGLDVGIEQQQYKIIEEIEQRTSEDIAWSFIQLLEGGNI